MLNHIFGTSRFIGLLSMGLTLSLLNACTVQTASLDWSTKKKLAWVNDKVKKQFPANAPSFVKQLNQSHPRLLIDEKQLKNAKANIEEAGILRDSFLALRKQADKWIIPSRPYVYETKKKERFLVEARYISWRLHTLATLYLLTDDEKYFNRLAMEVEAVCAYPAWDSKVHFLTTAEIAAAIAIAYDWLYFKWSEQQKNQMENALFNKVLTQRYRNFAKRKLHGFYSSNNNWNQVCNGGVVLAALAIADVSDDYGKEAYAAVRDGVLSVGKAMVEFDPEGASMEGPIYWYYGMGYNILMLAGLETALKSTFGLDFAFAGVKRSLLYPLYMAGPSAIVFNYSDCRPVKKVHPILWWMADKYNEPFIFYKAQLHGVMQSYREGNVEINRHEALHLFWLPKKQKLIDTALLSRDRKYAKIEVASFRSDWTTNALFVAFKGGSPGVAHGTMDVGSFVVDALGERWITMLPHENYDLPSFWSGRTEKSSRWLYYRNRAEGNNTLIIAPSTEGEQKVTSTALITAWQADAYQRKWFKKMFLAETSPTATVDLTSTYQHKEAIKISRTFSLPQRKKFVLTDKIQLSPLATSKDVWWFAHISTQTKVQIDKLKRKIILQKNGKQVFLKLVTPHEAQFTLMDAIKLPTSSATHPQEYSNADYKKIAIHLSNVTNTKITVEFSSKEE